MNEIAAMLERQAAWQRSRAGLTWTEKLRLAAQLRDAALAMRRPVIETPPPAGKPRVRPGALAVAEPPGRYRTRMAENP